MKMPPSIFLKSQENEEMNEEMNKEISGKAYPNRRTLPVF